jgi:hypothetical protein
MTSIAGTVTGQGQIARQLQDGINALINTEYSVRDKEYEKILEVLSSDKAYEEDVPFAGLGMAKVKPQGQGIEFDGFQEGALKRYDNVTYALGAIITQEAIEDNRYQNLMDKAARSLSNALHQTKETVAANVFNNGYNGITKTWDNENLFSTSHKLIKGGASFSNMLPTAADLSEQALEDALISISQYTDDAGLLIKVMAKSLHIPPQLQFIAQRILGSYLQNDTANNAVNAIGELKSIPGGYHVNHYLTDVDNWFIRTDAMDGGKMFMRKEDSYQQDNDFGTSNYMHKGVCRFSVGVSDFRQYFGSGNI